MRAILVLIPLGFYFFIGILSAQEVLPSVRAADALQIMAIMESQENAWNEGNHEAFMKGYWESDSLMYVGKSGISYGYDNTLARYRQAYPDQRSMGTLSFEILHLISLGKKEALMIGKWTLQRQDGDLDGHFSLVWNKIRGKWVIICDHSS